MFSDDQTADIQAFPACLGHSKAPFLLTPVIYTQMYFGHLKAINFPFRTNVKFMVLGVSVHKHFRVLHCLCVDF